MVWEARPRASSQNDGPDATGSWGGRPQHSCRGAHLRHLLILSSWQSRPPSAFRSQERPEPLRKSGPHEEGSAKRTAPSSSPSWLPGALLTGPALVPCSCPRREEARKNQKPAGRGKTGQPRARLEVGMTSLLHGPLGGNRAFRKPLSTPRGRESAHEDPLGSCSPCREDKGTVLQSYLLSLAHKCPLPSAL